MSEKPSSTETALQPCPFCGEKEELYPAYRQPGGGKPYAIDCLGCGIEFVPREGADVVAAWNRRAPIGTYAESLAKLAQEGWTLWDGGKCPIDEATRVEIRLRYGDQYEIEAGDHRWHHSIYNYELDIVAYRVA